MTEIPLDLLNASDTWGEFQVRNTVNAYPYTIPFMYIYIDKERNNRACDVGG